MFRRARTSSRRPGFDCERILLRAPMANLAIIRRFSTLPQWRRGGKPDQASLTTAMVAMMSTGAMAQSTVVTTTRTAHAALQQALVECLNGGWRITKKDRTVLEAWSRSCSRRAPSRSLRPRPDSRLPGLAEANACIAASGTSARVRRRPDSSYLRRGSGKTGNFPDRLELRLNAVAGARKMVRRSRVEDSRGNRMDDVPLKDPEVDSADDRRCLLGRYLQRRWEERRSNSEELASFGIAYPDRIPRDEC
jgi:hypothetical protein